MKQIKYSGLAATVALVLFLVAGCGARGVSELEVVEAAVATAQEPTVTPIQNTNPALLNVGLESTLTELYRRANPSVVAVLVPPISSGSGFVFSDAGYIVTNNHVIDGGRTYEVVFANGERRRATLAGVDVDSDLAVLKVDELPAAVQALPLADPTSIQVGQFAVAIGNPFGEQGSMSLGIVSGLGRSLSSQREFVSGSTYSLPEVIQTDAPINPGNSGGPLLNLAGEVIGVNAAIASQTGANSGVGFSIPVAAVRQVVPRLIEDGAYTYAFLGASFASDISLDELAALQLPQSQGAYIVGLTQGGPAARAGLVAANATTRRGGDLVVAIDGQAISDFDDLNRYLVFNTQPNQTIEMTIMRDNRTVVLPLKLGARP